MTLTSVVAVALGAAPASAASPGNDNFAAATALPSTASGSVSASNLDATAETGEPAAATDPGPYTTVWWSWVAPSTGTFLFDTCGSRLESTLGIYTGSSVDSLTSVAPDTPGECLTDGFWWGNEERYVDATAGSTYYLQVGTSQPGAMADVVLRWWPSTPPGNDNFAAAPALPSTASGSVTGTNRFATNETGEPFLSNTSGYAVWWKWTPPADGSYMFDTCASNFDTTLAIYSGSAVDTLTELASDDDGCSRRQSQVAPFDALASETYYIQVRGYGTESIGDITLNWQDATAPTNDNFAAATAISGSTGTVSTSSRFATNETGEPTTGLHSVWWRWTAPSTGAVIFDTCGSDFETRLGAFQGSDVSALTLTAEALPLSCAYQSMVMFDATAGSQYSIAVGDVGSAGDVELHWQMGSPPANDNFADATALLGAGGTATGTTRFATREQDEPGTTGRTVWWKWIAASDQPVSFDTCGSDLASAVAIYDGSAVGSLYLVGAGSNNYCGGQSRATFTPIGGTTYYIAVGSVIGGMGDVVLHWPAAGTLAAPSVTTHPSEQTVGVGGSTTMTAAADGLPTPTVQWEVSGDGTTWDPVAGADYPTLYLYGVDYTMNGNQYRAVFTNTEGTATSDPATLTVTPIAPAVISGPESQSTTDLQSVSFQAAGSGDPTPTVHWEVLASGGSTWADVSGATSTTLTFNAALAMNGNQYRAVFTNPGGDAATEPATLTVYPVPSGDSVTGLQATTSKGKVTVTFTAGGSPTFTQFQCQLTGKGSKGTWLSCTSGTVFKASANGVNVRGGYLPAGPWSSTVVSTNVVRSR